ncbi:uncharacterized protein LOC114308883 [Camellia sinensis]|uniref:uncharacterized protein LOC114308883 n=1 Tax=Camellia sinensis TaxID=4442 RepID=UPI001035AD50|nr:uncharacterized protein LOC114308883 [Camellia sinensis]
MSCMDSFYCGLTTKEAQRLHEYNFDHPDAFDSEQLVECIEKLKSGESVQVNASDIIILEGILVFHDPRVRNLMNMKNFVDTALPQPPKDFRKTFFPSQDFKKMLGLPVNQCKAPLLLNYIPTYKSTLPDVPKKRKSPPSVTTPSATSSPRPDQASTFNPAEQPSTSAPQLIPPP